MKAKIFYVSETGFTRRYAQWIAEETGLEAVDSWREGDPAIQDCAMLVIGSPVYGGEICGKNRLKKLLRANKNAKKLIFLTGLAPENPQRLRELCRHDLGMGEDISLWYFPGGLDKEKLAPSRRTELFLYRVMMKRTRDRTDTIAQLLRRTENSCDLTDREYIRTLTDAVREWQRAYAAQEEKALRD